MALEQPQAIRTVFLDAGFTLIRPTVSTEEICQQACRKLDLHIHLDQIRGRIHEAEDLFFQRIRENRDIWASNGNISQFWQIYYMDLLRPFIEEHDEDRLQKLAAQIIQEFDLHTNWEIYPDVLPTLEKLKAHQYFLGVISDWSIALGQILREHQLTQYFDYLIVSAAHGYAKPSAQLYDLALQRANAIADYTIHIGDMYINDVLGARAVGITPILLDRSKLVDPQTVDCLVIRSLNELPTLLEIS